MKRVKKVIKAVCKNCGQPYCGWDVKFINIPCYECGGKLKIEKKVRNLQRKGGRWFGR